MAIHLVRYAIEGCLQWGVAKADRIAPLKGDYPDTSALILTGEADWREAADVLGALPRSSVELLRQSRRQRASFARARTTVST
jgi:hypothetical protein